MFEEGGAHAALAVTGPSSGSVWPAACSDGGVLAYGGGALTQVSGGGAGQKCTATASKLRKVYRYSLKI